MTTLADLGGWAALLDRLTTAQDLTRAEACVVMATILDGSASPAQLAAFLMGMKAKGETAEEIAGLLDAVYAAATIVELPEDLRLRSVDLVGTGGDGSDSINVSTIAALVVAGAGVPVCKHGNRSASSKCGAADVLEALGVRLDVGPDVVAQSVMSAGVGFCFAPGFHPAFRFAGPTRKELGIRTVFNLLGPMANPGHVGRYVLGVADPAVAERIVGSLVARNVAHAWVVHGSGMDELTTAAASVVHEVKGSTVSSFAVDASDLGLARVAPSALVGGLPEQNARYARAVLAGERGAHRDIVVLNAAAGLVVGDAAPDLATALAMAETSIDSGAAAAALEALVEITNA
ncbi:MAG: anthranilate phosphoribosyltransferase [Ilumatobacteraceae bacterium]